MPDIQTHQKQAQHNLETIAYLQQGGEDHLDWVATILYYTALHLVDQVRYQSNQLNPRNHRQRHAAIASTPELQDVYVYYRELEYQSRRSRYECASFTSEEVQRLSNHLQKIQMAVTAVVG